MNRRRFMVPALLAVLLILILTAMVRLGPDRPRELVDALAAPAQAAGDAPRLAPPSSPLRAVQILNLDCKDWDEVDQRLAVYKSAGVQVVILRVFHNPGDGVYSFVVPQAKQGVYFRSVQVPVVADMLGTFCERAHRQGLGVVAWMTTRYANYGHEDETALRAMAWDFENKRPAPARGYSPLLPQVQDRLAALFTELAAYPIDGVLIQDDLVLRHLEGMNPGVLAAYEKETGRRADPAHFFKDVRQEGGRWIVGGYSDDYAEWRRWQNRGLIRLAQRLRSAVHQRRPGVPVGINIFYESLTDPANALRWYAQDLEAAAGSNLDFYALMLYHRQMADELHLSRDGVFDLIVESVKGFASRVDRKERIWVKLQCVDWDTGVRVPAAELANVSKRLQRLGPLGLVIVPTPPSLDRDALVKIFN